MENEHIPVLLRECIDGLKIKPAGIYVDGTLGRGGHSEKIAERLSGGSLICIDRDGEAIEKAKERLSRFGDSITFVRSNFRRLGEILDSLHISKVDGILLDLGVSSPQLDDGSRGFSYMLDAPLDMRMDKSEPLSAYDVVNFWTEEELRRILFEYGEERYASRIASSIVSHRDIKPVETTMELVDIIRGAMPASALREKQHPAKRSFQAIRIAVNDELGSLSDVLGAAMDRLNTGGRLAVISFHSLEDRMVKNAVRMRENGCICPPELPVCVCGFKRAVKSVTKKPITASQEELLRNPRARSAKLRIVERI